LASINADQQTGNEVDDLEQWVRDEPESQQGHLVAWIFGAFSILALILAAIGLYSVVSYSVTQRTNEFGIRMALGAQRGHVMQIVFASMLVSVGSGILAGLGLTLALNRILAAWAEGSSRDPVILLTSTLILIIVAGIACALPARRASRPRKPPATTPPTHASPARRPARTSGLVTANSQPIMRCIPILEILIQKSG